MGSQIIRRQLHCGVPLLRRVRATALCVARPGQSLQVQCQMAVRAEEQGVLFRKAEPRQYDARVWNGPANLDSDRGGHSSCVRERLRAMAEYRWKSVVSVCVGASGANHS